MQSWTLSSSDDDDDDVSILPSTQPGKQFASPSHIKAKTTSSTANLRTQKISETCHNDEKCYRKNPQQFKEFNDFNASTTSNSPSDPPKKKQRRHFCETSNDPLSVWSSAEPNYFFLTTCSGIKNKYNYSKSDLNCPPSLGIQDILSEDFRELQSSVQFNYCIDIEWLVRQYPRRIQNKPLLIVHGEQGSRLQSEAAAFPNIQLCRVQLPPYGTHHTKMMLLLYRKSLRVVISTANLIPQDWDKKTQGFYLSPMFSVLEQECETSSSFQTDLIEYLTAYRKIELKKWIEIIKKCDMTAVSNLRLVASVPGRHTGASLSSWGHMKLRNVLQKEVKRIDSSWPVIGQFSSIGSLGTSAEKWLCGEWITSMTACVGKTLQSKTSPLKLIFPTVENVRCSLEGYPAGASLPYSAAFANKQTWLRSYLHQWKADHVGRSHASPHIKSYTRLSPYQTNVRAPWFLLTSANLSKAAWGGLEKKGTQLALRSYELGVLFLPHKLSASKSGDNYFHIDAAPETSNKFTLPFSLPLVPYALEDSPWTWDEAHVDGPDSFGNVWIPS